MRRSERLNDTAAITGRPFAQGEDHSIHVRRIDNGFIVRTSTCNENTGEYKSSEMFTKNPPRITPPKVDGRQVGSNAGDESLAETKRYLGSKGV